MSNDSLLHKDGNTLLRKSHQRSNVSKRKPLSTEPFNRLARKVGCCPLLFFRIPAHLLEFSKHFFRIGIQRGNDLHARHLKTKETCRIANHGLNLIKTTGLGKQTRYLIYRNCPPPVITSDPSMYILDRHYLPPKR